MVSFKKKINIIIDDGDSFYLKKNININSLTFEDGEIVDVLSGEIYLGRDVEDKGIIGISHIKEIEDILKEMQIDKKVVPLGELVIRINELAVRISEGKGEFKTQENKIKAFSLINKFRRSIGLYPLEYGKYLRRTFIKKLFKRRKRRNL